MSGADPSNILNRLELSNTLRGSLQRAASYAYQQSHREVTVEHLLLSLTEDRDAAVILEASNVDSAGLVTEVSDYLGRLEDRVNPNGPRQPALGRDLIHIFQSAAAAAQKSQRRAVGSALILAAIVGEGRSPSAQMLRNHGLTFEQAIAALRQANAAQAARPVQPAPPPAADEPSAPPSAAVEDAGPVPTPAPPTQPTPAAAPIPNVQAARDVLAGARERVARVAGPEAAEAKASGADRPATPLTPSNDTEPPPTAPSQSSAQQPPTEAAAAADAKPASEPSPQPQPAPPQPAAARSEPSPRQDAAVDAPQPAATKPAQPSPEQRPAKPAAATRPSPPPPPPAAPAPAAARRPEPGPAAPPAPPPAPATASPHAAPAAAAAATAAAAAAGASPRWPEWAQHPRAASEGAQAPAQRPPSPRPPPRTPPSEEPPARVRAMSARDLPAHPDDLRREPGHPKAPPPRAPQADWTPRQPRGPSPPAAAEGRQPPSPASARGPAPPRAPAAPDLPPFDPRRLLEEIPQRMRAGRPVTVHVRVPRRELEAWSGGGSDPATLSQHVITKAMVVRLKAAASDFVIENASPETQWSEGYGGLLSDDIVSWRWTVTPRRSGRLPLQVSGSTRIVGRDGLAAERPLPTQRVAIRVSPDYAGLARRLAVWLLIAAGAGALGYFAEGLFDMGRSVLAQLVR